MKRGFTILELLAASLLLSMLVTVLTMIFNQSSIAWRTGVADVVELSKTRTQLGTYHDIEDDALPGLGQTGAQDVQNRQVEYRTVSVFRNWGGGSIGQNQSQQTAGRLYDKIQWGTAPQYNTTGGNVFKGGIVNISGGSSQGGDAYIVGVRCPAKGITTFPEDVN